MKIFLSWSGSLSHSVAEKLRTWLRRLIQTVHPFLSSRDIGKGELWLPKLLRELEESSVGIICVTRASLNSDWLLFESGALAKHVGKARVCTLLIDVSPMEVSGPLSEFQATVLKPDDVFRLVEVIHSSLDNPLLSPEELRSQFDVFWPEFEAHVRKVLSEPDGMRSEIQAITEDLLLPVIYREAQAGDLETVDRKSVV